MELETFDFTQFGYLAYAYDEGLLPLQVLNSPGGWYIGTSSDIGEPISRESIEYWETQEQAQSAFDQKSWTQKPNP
ncbi:MAG: hypothetical protein AAGD43_00870 [Pseudomonadota bacterium]